MAQPSQKPSRRTLEATQKGLNSVKEAAVMGSALRRGTQRRLPGAIGDSVQSGMMFIYLFIHSPICSFPCLTNTQVLQLVSQRMLTYKSEMDSEGDRALPSWEGYSSRTEQAWSGSLTELQTPLVVRLEPFLTPSQVV